MAIKTKEEILNEVKTIIGDNADDSSLSFVEDISDTLDDYSSRVAEDWRQKYEENDRQWRQRYRDRFFGGEEKTGDAPTNAEPEVSEEIEEVKTFDDLFEEVK